MTKPGYITIPVAVATKKQLLHAINTRLENLMPEIEAQFEQLRSALADEVAQAVALYQAELDQALQRATTAEEAASIATEQANRFTSGLTQTINEIRAPGLYGQPEPAPEPAPEPEPDNGGA